MSVSKAQQKAVDKYVKNNYDTMLIRVVKGTKQVIEAAAKSQGESINAYTKRALQDRIQADTGETVDL